MKAAALAIVYYSFLTGRAEHRANLGGAVHIVKGCTPELLHALSPLDRITASRNEYTFETREVAPRQKIQLLTQGGQTCQIDRGDPDVVRLKRFHTLDLGL